MRQFVHLHPLPEHPEATHAASALGFAAWLDLPGSDLARHRTGHTTHIRAHDNPLGIALVRKVYEYPTARDRRRGWLRNTWLASSRAVREGRMLTGLADRSLQPSLVVAVGEERNTWHVLRRCFLVTRWWKSRSLDEVLGEDGATRSRALRRLAHFVAELHQAGFLDRDLHLRNLLWNEQRLVKVDCPRGTFLPDWLHRRCVDRDLRDLGTELRSLLSEEERRRLWLRYRHQRRRPRPGRSATRSARPSCPGGTWPAPR